MIYTGSLPDSKVILKRYRSDHAFSKYAISHSVRRSSLVFDLTWGLIIQSSKDTEITRRYVTALALAIVAFSVDTMTGCCHCAVHTESSFRLVQCTCSLDEACALMIQSTSHTPFIDTGSSNCLLLLVYLYMTTIPTIVTPHKESPKTKYKTHGNYHVYLYIYYGNA